MRVTVIVPSVVLAGISSKTEVVKLVIIGNISATLLIAMFTLFIALDPAPFVAETLKVYCSTCSKSKTVLLFIAPVAFISKFVVSLRVNETIGVSPASSIFTCATTVPIVMFSSALAMSKESVGIVSGWFCNLMLNVWLWLFPAPFVAKTVRLCSLNVSKSNSDFTCMTPLVLI